MAHILNKSLITPDDARPCAGPSGQHRWQIGGTDGVVIKRCIHCRKAFRAVPANGQPAVWVPVAEAQGEDR